MDQASRKSVGLGGDGDEIFAIENVERTFGVKLEDADAPHWHTAGDVFSSLCKALPADAGDESRLWVRFTEALSAETGVDPKTIERESPLLSQSRFWVNVSHASAVAWLAAAAIILALFVGALF